jgi:hypothetical protein
VGLRGFVHVSRPGRDLLHVAVLVEGFAVFVRNSAGINKAQGFATDVAEYAEHPVTVRLNAT